MSDRNVCCLCGEEMDNPNSHNAYPANQKGGRCCTYCHDNVVIPMRIYIAQHRAKQQDFSNSRY